MFDKTFEPNTVDFAHNEFGLIEARLSLYNKTIDSNITPVLY